jgi:hypothetical protein
VTRNRNPDSHDVWPLDRASRLVQSRPLYAAPRFPIGTHFLWHSLNGLAAYLAMRAVILSQARRVDAAVKDDFA